MISATLFAAALAAAPAGAVPSFECPDDVTPVYTDFPGWKEDITKVRKYEDFPKAFKDYVSFIEKETGCPIRIISVGPDRSEIVIR